MSELEKSIDIGIHADMYPYLGSYLHSIYIYTHKHTRRITHIWPESRTHRRQKCNACHSIMRNDVKCVHDVATKHNRIRGQLQVALPLKRNKLRTTVKTGIYQCNWYLQIYICGLRHKSTHKCMSAPINRKHVALPHKRIKIRTTVNAEHHYVYVYVIKS